MTQSGFVTLLLVVVTSAPGCRRAQEPPQDKPSASVAQSRERGGAKSVMTFFVTSKGLGKGGDLGGLGGADAHCQALAQAEGAGDHTWRAYLSASARDGQPAGHARDRGGEGRRGRKGQWITRGGHT